MIVDKMEILNHVSGTVKGSKIKALRKLKKKKKKDTSELLTICRKGDIISYRKYIEAKNPKKKQIANVNSFP